MKDVVAGGGAGEDIECGEGFVEVEENHLVGDLRDGGLGCAGEGGEYGGDGLLLAEIGEESVVGCGGRGGDAAEDCSAEFGDALAGERRGFDDGDCCGDLR